MKLSANFSLEEFTRSDTAVKLGIKNEPGTEEIANLKNLCERVLQPIRDKVGRTIRISSGFRCPTLNRAVGGVESSQHVKGEAADITADGMAPRELYNFIVKSGIEYDQIILYSTMVHISRKRNRMQQLYAQGVKP
jgi:uncharacterized protein YcbK (DUF882 family)